MASWSPSRAVSSGLVLLATWASTAAAATSPSAGDYYVKSLPGAPADSTVKMHAGHIEITPESNGNMFFWHVANRHIAAKQRTVIWLNGGPGCSSEDGVMMEIGPYRLSDEDTLVPNKGSWHEFANLLFVDNPVGTGYSYVDTDSYVHELDDMADQFITFLEKFFVLFPEYADDEIYIAGESYAGQHIPYIAKHILDHNKGQASPWNLQGLLIGNGWISPEDQYETYLTYAYEKGLVQKGSDIGSQLEAQFERCQQELDSAPTKLVDTMSCELVLQEMLRLTQNTEGDDGASCINMYDVRLKDSYPSCGMNWPPDLEYVTPYLRKPEVVRALHINENKNTGWQECTGAVGSAFSAKNSAPSVELLPELLEHVRVLLFSGAEDLICNHKGTEALIDNLEWNGGKGFSSGKPHKWTFEGQDAGHWQQDRNLTYVLFNEASHMVPFDFPERSLDMLNRFLRVDIHAVDTDIFDSQIEGETISQPEHPSGSTEEPETDHEETTEDEGPTDEEIKNAEWAAYQKSGEVVLAIVAIAAAIWGVYIWRSRRRRAGYKGVPTGTEFGNGGTGLENFRNKRTGRDIEAGDFDESELDDLHPNTPPEMERERYSIGDDSDEDVNEKSRKGKSSK